MPASRCLVMIALIGASFAAAGCGEDEPTDTTAAARERSVPNKSRQTLADPPGDVLSKPASQEVGVTRRQLDLRSVTLRRTPDELVVSFATAAAPGPRMVQVIETYDRRQLLESRIEIRYRNGGVRAVARPPRGTFKEVPVDVDGRRAVVRAPLDEYTRERVFKWRAYTVSSRPTSEIRDRVPSRANDIALFRGPGA